MEERREWDGREGERVKRRVEEGRSRRRGRRRMCK